MRLLFFKPPRYLNYLYNHDMNSLRIKPYLPRLYLAVFIIFIINKLGMRSYVLEHEFPNFAKTIVLSLPNMCEAILGMNMVAGLLLATKLHFSSYFEWVSNRLVYLLAMLLTGTYVLTQEYELHNLGGNNVYDPYDVAASIIGLLGMVIVFSRFGVIEKTDSAA